MDKEKKYVEFFVYTPGCNWLDVVEVHFQEGENPGNQCTAVLEARFDWSGLKLKCR